MKIILITGINGSGGSYLAEHLLKRLKKVKIFGTIRKNKVIKSFNLRNLAKNKNIKFLKCDLNNFTQTKKIFKKIKFDYIYHLASNADVLSSFSSPREIVINNNNCTLNLLESLRIINSKTKIIICSTSEVYGNIVFHPYFHNRLLHLTKFKFVMLVQNLVVFLYPQSEYLQ